VFRREGGGLSGRFSFEGQVVEFADGDSVAAALLGHGVTVFRESAVSGAPRGPWLGVIVGVGGRQACLEAARDGMVVRRMRGAR
jgi:hypothetical protein